jgi:hypothetical protein
VLCLLGACHVTRSPQDNFTLQAGSAGIQPFVAAIEHAFGKSAQRERLNFPDSDPTELFEVSGTGVKIIVNPLPDDRCNPNAPMHSTYKQGQYRIDLVYETKSMEKREAVDGCFLVPRPTLGFR